MNKKTLVTPQLLWVSTLAGLACLLVAMIAPSIPAARAGAAPQVAATQPLDGKAVFTAQKCSLCHGVEALGIASKATSEKTKGPDLSTVGSERDAAWLGKFLHRQEKVDGKVHKKDLAKATDAEIEALATWLSTLKKV